MKRSLLHTFGSFASLCVALSLNTPADRPFSDETSVSEKLRNVREKVSHALTPQTSDFIVTQYWRNCISGYWRNC